ncbi:hypothetical protein B0H14DRAFT_3896887 [Mycena olivaceomarginata]|nr:hypothetical protein B0H14DRAFT_3896887 [Mycena olivaceomarginata]
MWLLLPLPLLFVFRIVSSTQVNHTIDDASPLVTYRAVIDRNLTGFDPSKLNDGTVTFIAATPHDSPTISMNFTGTAIYVFVAYPAGHNISFNSGFAARIDGVTYGGWEVPNTAPMTNHLAYRNTTMPNGPHNFLMQILPEWELYFDYAVYTSGDPDPSPSSISGAPTITTVPSVSPPGAGSHSSASRFSIQSSSGDPDSSSTSSPSVSMNTSNSLVPMNTSSSVPMNTSTSSVAAASMGRKFPVGAVVGAVIGGVLLLAALLCTLFLLRRRDRLKQEAYPFVQAKMYKSQPGDKEIVPSSINPFLLQSPSTAQVTEKVPLSLDIPNAPRMSMGDTGTALTPLSAASHPSSALLQMRVAEETLEEMRRLRASMQRLETGMPEARDGGPAPIVLRPPPYGMSETI